LRLNKNHPILKRPENQDLLNNTKDTINNFIKIKNISPEQSIKTIKANNEIFNQNEEAKKSAIKYFGNLEKEIIEI
jgi:hypothetical protein